MTYKAEYKADQLIYGTGKVIVVTGWTPKEAIAKRLDENEYAAIGNLYSAARGINFIVRNLLLNPHIRDLVILNLTKQDGAAGSSQCLFDFFIHGVERDGDKWKIISPVDGWIDGEISEAAISVLRYNVKADNFYHREIAIHVIKELGKKKSAPPYALPMQYPLPQGVTDVLPGAMYGHRIEAPTIAEAWLKILHRIRSTGNLTPTDFGGNRQELIDVMSIITEETGGFLLPDWVNTDIEAVESYITSTFPTSSDDGSYTYGSRLNGYFYVDQIDRAIALLINNPDSTRIVLDLWDAHRDADSKQPPCLNHIWLRIIDNKVSLTAVFRSHDIYSAYIPNAFFLRTIQIKVVEELNRRAGKGNIYSLAPLVILSESCHIYDDCFDDVDKLIERKYKAIARRKIYDDPVGNFIIEILDNNDGIKVTRTTPQGDEVVAYAQYDGDIAAKLLDEIILDAPSIQPSHAAYLGMELAKAAIALQQGNVYTQDTQIAF